MKKNIDERLWILICLREISITNSPRNSRREVIRHMAFHYIIHTTAYSVIMLLKKKLKEKKMEKMSLVIFGSHGKQQRQTTAKRTRCTRRASAY